MEAPNASLAEQIIILRLFVVNHPFQSRQYSSTHRVCESVHTSKLCLERWSLQWQCSRKEHPLPDSWQLGTTKRTLPPRPTMLPSPYPEGMSSRPRQYAWAAQLLKTGLLPLLGYSQHSKPAQTLTTKVRATTMSPFSWVSFLATCPRRLLCSTRDRLDLLVWEARSSRQAWASWPCWSSG